MEKFDGGKRDLIKCNEDKRGRKNSKKKMDGKKGWGGRSRLRYWWDEKCMDKEKR